MKWTPIKGHSNRIMDPQKGIEGVLCKKHSKYLDKKIDYIQEVIFYVRDVLVAAKGKHNQEGDLR